MSLQFKFIQPKLKRVKAKGINMKTEGNENPSPLLPTPWNIIAIRIGYFGNSSEFDSIFIAFKSNLILYLQFSFHVPMNGAQIQIDNVSKSETQEPTELNAQYYSTERKKVEKNNS